MEIFVSIAKMNVYEVGYIRTLVVDHSAHTTKEGAVKNAERLADTHGWLNLHKDWESQNGLLTAYVAETTSHDGKDAVIEVEIWRERLWDR